MATQQELLVFQIQTAGDDQLTATAKALAEVGKSGGDAAPQANALLERLAALANQDSLISTLLREKVALQETGDQLALQKLKLADLQAQMALTSTPSAALERSFAKTQGTIATLDASYGQHQANLGRTSLALQAAGVDTEHLDTAQRNIKQTLTNTAAEAEGLGKSVGNVAQETEKAGAKAAAAGTLFGGLKTHLAEIVSIAAAVGLALKGIEFGSESIKRAEDVEASLARVKALAGGAAESFEGMDAAIEKAAEAVNTTSESAAGGLAALVSNGLSAKAAIDALVPTLQLAKIANIDVGTAAKEVADALKAFDLPASEAQSVVDQLTSASHGAAGGLAAVSGAAVQLAPDAKALGLNFTGLVSILGLLSSRGLDTEKSVRGLRTVFQELQDPSSKLRGELLALGDGTNDFGSAIAALTSGTPRANEALNTLSGPARTLIELLGQAGPDAIERFNAKLRDTQGEASRTSTAIDQTLRGSATSFGNAIDEIGAKLAQPVLKPLTDELFKLAGELNEFRNSPDFAEIRDQIGKIASDGIEKLDKVLHQIDWKGFLTDAKNALKDVGDDLKAVADSASTIATVVGKTADTVGIAYHTLGAGISAAVGVAATGVEELTGNTETLDDVARIAAEQAGQHYDKLKGDVTDLAGASEKAASAATDQGAASADAAPKVEQHAQATEHLAAATHDAVTELPTMEVHARASAAASENFAEALQFASTTLADLKDKSGNAVTGLDAVKTAMGQLHLTSQQQLQGAALDAATYFTTVDKYSANTAAGLADRQNAFLAYARAALAASAQLDDGTRLSVEAQLESKASVLGVTDALADLEKQSDSSQAALVSDANRGAAALDKELDSADRLAGKLHGGGGAGDGSVSGAVTATGDAVAEAQRQFTEWGVESGKTAQQLGADTSHANEGMQDLAQGIANARTQYLAVSDAAAKFYDLALKGNFDLGHSDDGSGFDRVARAMQAALKATDDEIAANRAQLQGMVDAANQVGTESVDAFDKLGGAASYTEQQLEETIAAVKAGNLQVGILGQQDLAPLQAALDAAKQRVDALKQASEQAKQQLADMSQQLQDDVDNAAGNQEAVEDRRYQQQLANLKAAAQAAGELNSQQYQTDVNNANQLHALKMQQIEQQAKAQQQSTSGGGTSSGSGSAGAPAAPNGSGVVTSAAISTGASSGLDTLNINHAITVKVPSGAGLKGLSDADIRAVAEHVVSTMGPELTSTVLQQLAYARSRTA